MKNIYEYLKKWYLQLFGFEFFLDILVLVVFFGDWYLKNGVDWFWFFGAKMLNRAAVLFYFNWDIYRLKEQALQQRALNIL